MFERYKSYSPYDMLESIKKEVKGDLENAFLNLGKQVWPFLPGREVRDRRSEWLALYFQGTWEVQWLFCVPWGSFRVVDLKV